MRVYVFNPRIFVHTRCVVREYYGAVQLLREYVAALREANSDALEEISEEVRRQCTEGPLFYQFDAPADVPVEPVYHANFENAQFDEPNFDIPAVPVDETAADAPAVPVDEIAANFPAFPEETAVNFDFNALSNIQDPVIDTDDFADLLNDIEDEPEVTPVIRKLRCFIDVISDAVEGDEDLEERWAADRQSLENHIEELETCRDQGSSAETQM